MQDPALALEYERCTAALKNVLPITPEIKAVLHTHYSFDTTPVRPRQGCALFSRCCTLLLHQNDMPWVAVPEYPTLLLCQRIVRRWRPKPKRVQRTGHGGGCEAL